jgi:hypothetical protein
VTGDEAAQPRVLREYALLADGERGALVGPLGEVAWMCFPRWDSPAVFPSLIGGSGLYSVRPRGRFVWGGYYEPGSLIWRSRWTTTDGVVESRDALAFPGDPGRAVLLRRLGADVAESAVEVCLALRGRYGAERPQELRRDERGRWTARVAGLHVRWSCPVPARPLDGDELVAEVRIGPGEQRDLVLEIAEEPLPEEPVDPDEVWHATESAWAREVPLLSASAAPRDARHSYAVLRGLTASSGGMVAAATTSLPERAEQGRNYDYRYVWIRDQCYVGQAAAVGEPLGLLDDAVRFVTARLGEDGPHLAPAYTASGGSIPEQQPLDLPGYPGGSDLIGNQVRHQFQLDSFGEALLLLAAADRHDRLDADGWKAAVIAADAIGQRHREPDAGIWELQPARWAHSRLICAAGLRAVAERRPDDRRAGDWSALADQLVADAARTCTHPSGRWQRAPHDPRVDAALLLPALRGAVPPADPRSRRTVQAVREELTDDLFVYRFRHDDRPLGEAEGAFVMCGFVMALAEEQQGNRAEAMRWFERNRAACGPAGLFAEEYDVTQRQLRGNLPQAFVHGWLLESARRLGAR